MSSEREKKLNAEMSVKRVSIIEKLFAEPTISAADYPVSLTPEQAAKIAEEWVVDDHSWIEQLVAPWSAWVWR